MSGFSSELIDYLEGKITFEEFDRRRDERKSKVKKNSILVRRINLQKQIQHQNEGVSAGVQLAFASIIGETPQHLSSEDEEEEEEDNEEEDNLTAGDVFALEMELNRENKKMMKERRHRSKLPRALRGLMGEANIRYARGETEDAILMCMEIIRQAPLAYEPFSTLTMIYEDNNDMEKALQFGLIAAHLNPSDCDEWIRLAEMSLEQDNIRQAIVCYTKAIKYDPTNVRYLWERCSLHMRLGEHKQCMDGYRRILSLLPMEEGEHFMQLSKDMAKSYYESNDMPAALGVIEEALARHPNLVSDDVINMAAELYISNHQYDKAMQVRVMLLSTSNVEKTNEEVDGKNEESINVSAGEILDVHIPDSVPVDLRAKVIVSLIHLHVYTPLEELVASLMEHSAEEVGDLYLDVSEAYMEEGQYESALPMLSTLVVSEKYNLAVVWLRHAECLKALGHMGPAADSYAKVVEKAPQHLEARLSLATLLQQLGRPEGALKALESMYDSDTLAQDSSAAQKELKLLLHRSTLLKTQGQTQKYLDSMITMISMLLKVTHTDVFFYSFFTVCIQADFLQEPDWWQLLVTCLLTLCEVHRYEETDLLVESAMEFYSFYDIKPRRKELEFLGLSATILDHNHYKAYNYIRLMLMENVNLPQLWNIFNQLTIKSEHQRHHRFCLRLLLKHPDNHALCVLCGHNAMVSGSFKLALGQYVQAFQSHACTPMYSLCVGLTYFHMASQKYVAKRHALVLQGFSFLWRYVELRGECQESMYNLGRALHQMGLVHLAIHYYQKALTLPAQKLEGISDDQVDLRREIAFNLSLIYQDSGNMEMARQLIVTHCIV
uniref:General transcription factor IIIC, polypeptide 3 n=1 Tax=Sphaeramia orbicularis TaxID=375764 RepID=A0A672YUV2_9TELE